MRIEWLLVYHRVKHYRKSSFCLIVPSLSKNTVTEWLVWQSQKHFAKRSDLFRFEWVRWWESFLSLIPKLLHWIISLQTMKILLVDRQFFNMPSGAFWDKMDMKSRRASVYWVIRMKKLWHSNLQNIRDIHEIISLCCFKRNGALHMGEFWTVNWGLSE